MYELIDAQMTNGFEEKALTYIRFDANFRREVIDAVSTSELVMLDALDATDWIPAGSMVGFGPQELQSGAHSYVATQYTAR